LLMFNNQILLSNILSMVADGFI